MDKMKGGGIYKIVNLINNKIYIGSAVKFYNRFHIHKHHLKIGKHHSLYLQRAYNKYGENAFEFHILEVIENPTKEKLIEREQFYLDSLKPDYNIAVIAGSNLGIKRSEETKRKQSLLKLGKPGPRLGAIIPQEMRNRISAKLKGRKQSKETISKRIKPKSDTEKAKISIRMKGNKFRRKSEKWPHELGIKCKCRECLDKHAAYHRNRRLNLNAARSN